MIQLDCVSKSYGSTLAVDDLSLVVDAGEVVGLLGPNGAGKTTTLKLIVGLLRSDRGAVRVDGRDVAREPEAAKQQIGFVPDSPYIYDKLTGREFLQLVGGMYGMTAQEVEEGTDRLFAMFGVEWGDDRAENYSHGMRQRVVMCAALLHKPKALVFDEPTVGLDPQSARLVRTLFRQSARSGAAVIISTHSLHLAEEVCDRIAIMNVGRLVHVGTKDDLAAEAKRNGETLEEHFIRVTGGVLTPGEV